MEVVLLRSAAGEEVPLRTPEVAAEAHLDLPAAGARQQKYYKVLGQRFCFCVALQAREVAVVFPAAGVPRRQPMVQEPVHLQRTSDRSAGH